MIPVVSERYKYILFYNPKSACSVARQIFLKLHRDELSPQQQLGLDALRDQNQDEWHDLSELFCLDLKKDYSNYFKFTLVRHPVSRFVSAYLNRVVLHQTDQKEIAQVLLSKYGSEFELTYSFRQFVDYLAEVKLEVVSNTHFLPQSDLRKPFENYSITSPYFKAFSKMVELKHRLLRSPLPLNLKIDHVCKVESLKADMLSAYKKIFVDHPEKLTTVSDALNDLSIHNVTLSDSEYSEGAIDRSANDLRGLKSMPSYASFVDSSVLQVLKRVYRQDFQLFDYAFNLDAATLQFEKDKAGSIADVVPSDFDWSQYLALNADLPANGINSQVEAVSHWIHHGRFENRQY